MDSPVLPIWSISRNHEKQFFSIIYLGKILVGALFSIPHNKGLYNLAYEIRVCPKIHNKVTMTMSSYS